jgi:hypothetical protein
VVLKERALSIPHALEPAEVAALIRIGEALADIQVRLAAMMGRPGGPVARELADLATLTIDLLDVVKPDPDEEEDIPLEDGGDDEPEVDDEPDADSEPSLGWTLGGLTASGNDHHNLDCEADEAEHGYELPPPLKAWSAWAGRSQRRERL